MATPTNQKMTVEMVKRYMAPIWPYLIKRENRMRYSFVSQSRKSRLFFEYCFESARSQNDSKQTKPRGSITKNPQPDPSHSTVCRSQSGKCDEQE